MIVRCWTRVPVAMLTVVGLGCGDRSLNAPETDAAPSPAFSKSSSSQPLPVVVVLRDESAPTSGFLNAVAKSGGRVKRRYDAIGVLILTGLKDVAVTNLAARPDIEAINRDRKLQWLPPAPALTALGDQSGAPLFPTYQWDLRQINADDAWLVSPQGGGALVCILDTGVDPGHSDLVGRVDLDKSTSFVSDEPSIEDYNFHGTFVGAIIASNGKGMASVAPAARLCAVKVLNRQAEGGFDEVIAGTMYAASVGADVINMSLGARLSRSDPSARALISALQRAIRFAVRQGALVVAGAGNDGLDLDQTDDIIVPAELAGVLSVGATGPFNQTNFDRLASYTNFGKTSVDLMAPGGEQTSLTGNIFDGILSACSRFVSFTDCSNGTRYLTGGFGTSFAAPHVSGAAAVVESMLPGDQNASQLETCLFLGADNPDGLQLSPLYGRGRLNVLRSVQSPGCGLGVAVNPATQLAFSAQPSRTVAGGPITPAVQITIQRNSDGSTVTGFQGSITVTIGKNVADGTLLGTFNRPVLNGVATFDDLSIDEPGTGYTLRATAVSSSSPTPGDATSSPFDIVAATATQLAFTVQPGNTAPGLPIVPAVQVTALDEFFNPVRSFGGAVTLSIASPTGATLSGTTTVTPLNGVATFGDLTVDKPGAGYVLIARAAGLVEGTSSLFNVTVGPFTSVSAGFEHTCGLALTGRVFCWGHNTLGQLGDGTTTDHLTPLPVALPAGVNAFTSVTSGASFACGLTAAGAAFCWGADFYGQLGDGNTTNQATPLAVAVVMPAGVTFATLTALGSSACGLTSSGDAYCWGYNFHGQLGIGNSINQSTPVKVLFDVPFASLSAGEVHTCGLTAAGQAWCWGDNSTGQLGDGVTASESTAVTVQSPTGVTFDRLAAGGTHTCGLTAGGADCWGSNSAGQLGDGDPDSYELVPVQVTMPSGQTFISLGAGGVHTCALAMTGAAYCWGSNNHGQLGNQSSVNAAAPVAVHMPGGVTFAKLSLSIYHSCGLTPDGAAYCWGDNEFGQLGDGTSTDQSIPTPVRQ